MRRTQFARKLFPIVYPSLFSSLFTVTLLLSFNLYSPQVHAKDKGISIACGAVGLEYELCKSGAQEWSQKSGVPVELVSTPNDTNQKLALFQQLLSSKSEDIDVFMVDVIWPGVLHNHFVDLNGMIPADEKSAHFQNLIDNNTVENRLVALPWYVDTGLIYYRKDLLKKYGLEIPTTWSELTSAAEKIQAGEKKTNSKFVGYVFQGKAYEGLTCNAIEWTTSFGGNTFVLPNGEVKANTPENVAALEKAASWVETIAPKGVLNYAEEEARGVFQSGGAAFMRNWPYAWKLANAEDSPIAGKVGVMPIPKGGANGKNSPILGGWQLSVSKYSKKQKEAAGLVLHLTSQASQKDRLIKGGFFPTRKALYQIPALKKGNPVFAVLGQSLETAAARPSKSTGSQYNRASNEIWNAVFSVLSKDKTAKESLEDLDKKLGRISRGGKWK